LAVKAPAERDRYSRQTRFSSIGPAGQERLRAGRVLVVGCGALGSAVVDLLARAGVGHLTIVDRDFVELSNLQRQLLFDESDAEAGLPKAIAAARAVARINSGVVVEPVVADVTPNNVEALMESAQVVIDGTDNLETRYLLNDACVKRGTPWVYGGAVASTGMAMAIVPGQTACFRCLFPVRAAAGTLATCDTAGVLGSTVVAVAAFQWTSVVKLLVGSREGLGELAAFDVWTQDSEHTSVPRQPECPCCAQRRFEYLEAKVTSRTATLCGRNAVQVSPAAPVVLELGPLAERLAGLGEVSVRGAFLVRFAVDGFELTLFPDGRAIVKGTSEPSVARALYARYVGA
jgi:adenylyltransferase/sulfurtransferase